MSSDSENVAEEIEQELTITKRSLPNTEEAKFKKNNFVLVVPPELETVAEGSEQEQSMLRKRSLPNPAEVRSKKKQTIREIPSEIIDLETVAEGSEQQGQGLSRSNCLLQIFRNETNSLFK